jgi:hypothetical protein
MIVFNFSSAEETALGEESLSLLLTDEKDKDFHQFIDFGIEIYDDNKQRYQKIGHHIQKNLINLYNSPQDYDKFINFSDAYMREGDATERVFKAPSSLLREYDFNECLQVAAIYKGIYSFLSTDERVNALDAELLLVYSLWQWFNYLKLILEEEAVIDAASRPKNFFGKIGWYWRKYIGNGIDEITLTDKILFLVDELSFAYKAINGYLQDPNFIDSFKYIYFWDVHEPLAAGYTELMTYSLVLSPIESKKDPIPINTPFKIPGFSQNNQFDWDWVKLHPVFKLLRPANLAVMRLVTHYALPNYDFDASLNLAHLLKKNEPLKIKNLPYLFIFVLISLVSIPIIINNVLAPLDIEIFSVRDFSSSLALLIISIGFVASLISLLLIFERSLIVHLILPRVWAGIFVGYFALLFESGSVQITCALWEGSWLGIFALWFISIAISWIYLFHDIRPWAMDNRETWERTLQTFGITLLISILVGLIVIPLSTYAYKDPIEFCVQLLLKGIYGTVDVQQLVVFIPLAYLTGLVSQFIFEEKPLTTSVWAPIRE